MSRTAWTWVRLIATGGTVAFIVWRLGTGPFLDGVGTVDAAHRCARQASRW